MGVPRSRARVLMAIAWMGVASVAWCFWDALLLGRESEAVAWVDAGGLFVAPPVAVGAFFGRARLGAAVGILSLLALSLALTIAGSYAVRSH